jgi:acid phosphatase type 7
VAAGTSLLRAQSAFASDGFLRHPNIQNVGPDAATVLWTLPMATQGSVVVTDPSGVSKEFLATRSRFDPAETGMSDAYHQYRATLSGLSRSTSYLYQVRADGLALGSPNQFRTEHSGPFRLLHFADSGEGSGEQIRLFQQHMAGEEVSLVLANGDLAYDLATHTSVEDRYYGVYRDMMAQVPFFATLGNHEYYTDSGAPSLASRVTPTSGVPVADRGRYYSFDWGNTHFVALDTNAPLAKAVAGNGEMLRWLEEDLRATRKFWRVAFFHHPGYATGKHQNEPEAAWVRDHIVPILETRGVQLVFNGHEHTYQRTYELRGGSVVPAQSGGIVYVTSGGGGAQPSYFAPDERIAQSAGVNHYVSADVAGSTVRLRTRGLDHTLDIDTYTLAPKPFVEAVVNGASFAPNLASGGSATIFGRNLCSEETVPQPGVPMLEAHGCSVTLDGTALPLLYADAMQINFQLPFSFSGAGTLRVITPNGTAEQSIRVNLVAPELFANPQAPTLALVTREGGALVDATAPASAGEKVTLLVTGLGAVQGSARVGEVPLSPLPIRGTVRVVLGNSDALVLSAALSSAAAGVYEVQFVMSSSAGKGLVPVQVIMDGTASNILSVPRA